MDFSELLAGDYEQIQVLRDDAAGVLAFVAIDDTRLGPAFGGIRRWSYRRPVDALADALRLAEAMTLKCAAAGVPGGGGKTVIAWRPGTDRRSAYRLVGQFVEEMGGRYYTGPDVGTEDADLDVVAEETRFVARPELTGNLGEPTALGVFAGIEALVQRIGHPDLSGVHVLVQGLGEVGSRLVALLAQAGARVTVTDVRREPCAIAAGEHGARVVDPGELLGIEADVFAPCALGGVIHDLTVESLRVRAVAGSANNVLATPEHGQALFDRGILYAPDFVISAGALLHGALFHLEGEPPPPERIRLIGERVGAILDQALIEHVPPEIVARRIARERVERAGGGRFLPRRSR